MNTKPGVRRTTHPVRVLAAFLALILAASGLALAVSPASPAGAASAPVEGTYGELVWGVKASFRSYIKNPVLANGQIQVSGGATQAADNGVFTFPLISGSGNGTNVTTSFAGAVHFTGHYHTYGELVIPLLDVKISNIRVDLTGDDGVLVADVVSRPFEGTDPEVPPEPVTYDDVELADLDATGVTPNEGVWSGIEAVLSEAGVPAFGDFYPAGQELDPVSFSIEQQTASIQVSQTTGLDPVGPTTVTVTGSGFNPYANLSTRPPVPVGSPTGVYVVFGRFPDTWQPSQGVPSSARKVFAQNWAIPAVSKSFVDPSGTNPTVVLLEEDGTFETTLQISAGDAPLGNYGVFTYAAGGAAANPANEIYEPISFTPVFNDVPQGNAFFGPISWLKEEGISNGFEGGFFEPDLNITRQAVAAFLWRMAGEPTPPPGHPTFTDVPLGHPFYEAISWLAAEGITNGFPDDTFRPGDNVTREAMAAFLWRDADEPTPPPDHPTFTDVSDNHVFYEAISWLADVGVTTGFPDDTFRPSEPITRQAMAAFLYRYAHLA